MLLRIWEGKRGREKRRGQGPKGVQGWRWGSFHASPRVWVKAIISQNMSQFSSEFSKALVTQTPKGVKSPVPCPRHGQADPLFEARRPLQIAKKAQGASAAPLCLALPPLGGLGCRGPFQRPTPREVGVGNGSRPRPRVLAPCARTPVSPLGPRAVLAPVSPAPWL